MDKMTFNDAIVKLLEVIDFKYSYPIKIIMGLKNSQYIDLELFDKNNLDTILKKNIPDINDLSIVWLDDNEQLNMKSLEQLSIITSNRESDLMQNCLKPYKFVGKTTDNRYEVYLYLLPDEIEKTIDGITYKNNEIQLPDFHHFKYQNLYTYQDKEKFNNAILW